MIKPSNSVFFSHLKCHEEIKRTCTPFKLSKNVPVQKSDRPLCDAGTKLNEKLNDQQSFPFFSREAF